MSGPSYAWQRKTRGDVHRYVVGGLLGTALLASYIAWPSERAMASIVVSPSSLAMKDLAADDLVADPTLPCKRTLTLDWDSWSVGIGSGIMTLLQAATWGDVHGYQVLVSKGRNNYGPHDEYFLPPVLSCTPDEAAYGMKSCWEGTEDCPYLFNRTTGERLKETLPSRTALGVWTLYPVNPVNRWISQSMFDFKSLEGLPLFSSQKPLALPLTLPPALQPAFTRMQQTFNRTFRLNPGMEQLVDEKAQALNLHLSPGKRVPVVGVHFRAGDKLIYECIETPRMSCANVTLHIEAAKHQLEHVKKSASFRAGKPKLVLLTAESDALANFTRVNQEHFGGLFDVVTAPASSDADSKGKSFKQGNFNSLPLDARIADTRDLLGNLAMLARGADGFVVSGNTNVGRVASLFANRPLAVTSFDFWWHPTLYLLAWPECMGVGHCIPR